MLYIHKLPDLGKKSAEIESVYILRELKRKFSLPINLDQMEKHLYEFYVSETDLEAIKGAISLIPPTVAELKAILAAGGKSLEPVNFERSTNILNSLVSPLKGSLVYCTERKRSQERNIREITNMINLIPATKRSEEKITLNRGISQFFEGLFRNKEFMFNCADIVNEGGLSQVQGLSESAAKGFFYHWTLEEELKKLHVNEIKARVPVELVERLSRVEESISQIRKGTEKAYTINKNMVELSVIIYSFVKWANGG